MTSENRQDALLDELLRGCSEPKDILGEHGLLKQLQKRLVERALQGEMTAHLGYEPHAPEGHGSGNSRNGKGRKTVQTEAGQFEIEVPRDREGILLDEAVNILGDEVAVMQTGSGLTAGIRRAPVVVRLE